MLDADAPEDAESCRWWCYTGAAAKETDRLRIQGTANVAVRATGEGIGSMLEGVGATMGGGVGSAPSMQSIMQVMNETTSSTGAARAKPKPNPNRKRRLCFRRASRRSALRPVP